MDFAAAWMGWLALGCIVVGGILLLMYGRSRVAMGRHIDALIAESSLVEPAPDEAPAKTWAGPWLDVASGWLDTKLGQLLVAPEDRALLAQCGYQAGQSRTLYLLARLGAAVLFPLAMTLALPLFESRNIQWFSLFAAFVLGFLAPKWYLRKRAAQRMRIANKELLVLVDVLALLQGAGLGVDQSLHVIAKDFRAVMPVLCAELDVANRLYASGRTREQAMQRMSELLQSDALADLAAIIVQIDKHGGAVQAPLRQFGERLREQRRMQMKEAIGKITVKMTGVMVLTLLPALLIVTAGPGFLSVIRALGGMK